MEKLVGKANNLLPRSRPVKLYLQVNSWIWRVLTTWQSHSIKLRGH